MLNLKQIHLVHVYKDVSKKKVNVLLSLVSSGLSLSTLGRNRSKRPNTCPRLTFVSFSKHDFQWLQDVQIEKIWLLSVSNLQRMALSIKLLHTIAFKWEKSAT